ncbi:MAG: hypothetical protein PSV26_21195 [Polaromonas sp.]|uniref:hypothetical protein n=1 Tax=Polaromonas sp. TaxID=1869339 RepID=UPI0024888EE9|nr:hypothetical protein [Polaromonas sp.]MDI1240006.1 hypothetical protein [Polaromonas sp.]
MNGYSYTPLAAAAEAAHRVLNGEHLPGFRTPAQEFGGNFAEGVAGTRVTMPALSPSWTPGYLSLLRGCLEFMRVSQRLGSEKTMNRARPNSLAPMPFRTIPKSNWFGRYYFN